MNKQINNRLTQDIEEKKYDPRVNVSLMNGQVAKCVDVEPRVFNTYLIDKLGMTFKRACLTGIAIEHLHAECCALDDRNRSKIMNMKVCEILDLFGKHEEMYSSFQKDWESKNK
tara:strand:+ start:652 stop:993 length:342 start_codon:yes stop_codon:yes gene_type:complete